MKVESMFCKVRSMFVGVGSMIFGMVKIVENIEVKRTRVLGA